MSLFLSLIQYTATLVKDLIILIIGLFRPYVPESCLDVMPAAGGLVCAGVLFYLYYWMTCPLNRVVNLGEKGYVSESWENKRRVFERVKRLRQVGNCPPVYPNGWFGLMESWRIKNGESKPVCALGLQLAVFRDDFGEAHVVDAICPHMGAHLGVGGKVRGRCIECPFHGWLFHGEDGKCTHIPYLIGDKIPEQARVKPYSVTEVNEWIYIWYDAEGREPTWTIPTIEEIAAKEWTYRGRTEHQINAHIEEIPENGADVAHLKQVHGPTLFAGTDLRFVSNKFWQFNKHEWTAEWNALEGDQAHIGHMKLKHVYTIWGRPVPFTDFLVDAKQIGPGIVYLFFNSLFGRGVFLHTLTPMEPLVQRMVHNVYANRWMPTIVAKFLMIAEAEQVDRDLMIWNNKAYAGRPVFVRSKEDNLVARHRRWYSQFYSEHSPRLTAKSMTDVSDW